jgi:hypothetical protein
MANEISFSFTFDWSKGGAVESVSSGTVNVTVAGSRYIKAIQNIGTSEESVGLGELANIGYAIFHNMDATNYVEVGLATGVYQIKLKAGQWALLPLDGSAVFAKANTAAVNLEYFISEL